MVARSGLSTFVAAAALAGCGTILSSNPQKVEITSDPPGARVKVNGEDKGVTPMSVALSTKASHEITVEADGYPARSQTLASSIAVGYVVADVLLGLVPLAVDIATDSLHKLDDDEVHFQFAEVKAPPPAAAPAFNLKVGGGRAGGGAAASGGGSAGSAGSCCVNRAFYACPSAAAVAKCMPPQLATCMMSCGGFDFSCPEKCMADHPTDPSACTRDPARDSTCR